MRLLLIHNYYGSAAPSGENLVFEAEAAMLGQRGNKVAKFVRYSDTIRIKGIWGKLQGAFSTPWNLFALRAIKRTVESFHPDVVHVHNSFPLLSPSIFYGMGNMAARVLTLHNYRLFCPAAIPMRNGRICTDCLNRCTVLPAIRHSCYRGNLMATLPLAVNVGFHRIIGTWLKRVDAFIVLSKFQRNWMIKAGLPADRVYVKPNFYPGNPAIIPWNERRKSVVFAGRLTAEKGVETLIRAWHMWGELAPELRIVGDGRLRLKLERLAARVPEVPIRFIGQVSGDTAQVEIASSRLLVLPSECFEGFPMVVREAFAFGTPAAVSNIGPLPSIVRQGENGLVFEAGDPLSLFRMVRFAWEKKGNLEALAMGARRSFELLYTEEANYKMLRSIYEKSIIAGKKRMVAQ